MSLALIVEQSSSVSLHGLEPMQEGYRTSPRDRPAWYAVKTQKGADFVVRSLKRCSP